MSLEKVCRCGPSSAIGRVDTGSHSNGISGVEVRIHWPSGFLEGIKHWHDIFLPLSRVSNIETTLGPVIGLLCSNIFLVCLWKVGMERFE